MLLSSSIVFSGLVLLTSTVSGQWWYPAWQTPFDFNATIYKFFLNSSLGPVEWQYPQWYDGAYSANYA
jgi:hypothetical protein